MHLVDEELPSLMPHQASFRFRVPARMDLTSVPKELNPGFVLFLDKIVVIDLPVFGHNFHAFVLHGTSPPAFRSLLLLYHGCQGIRRERRSVKQKMLQLGGGVEGEVTVSFHKGGHLRQILPAPTGPGKGGRFEPWPCQSQISYHPPPEALTGSGCKPA